MTTAASEMPMVAPVDSGASFDSKPTTGSSQDSMSPQNSSAMPRKVEPRARMISGIVMTLGDSCGWTPSSQRGLPRKVMMNIRVM